MEWLNKPFPEMELDMEPGSSVGLNGEFIQSPATEIHMSRPNADTSDGNIITEYFYRFQLNFKLSPELVDQEHLR